MKIILYIFFSLSWTFWRVAKMNCSIFIRECWCFIIYSTMRLAVIECRSGDTVYIVYLHSARACANLQPVELSRSSLHACQLPEYVFRASELRCNQKFLLKSDLSTAWRCVASNSMFNCCLVMHHLLSCGCLSWNVLSEIFVALETFRAINSWQDKSFMT